MIEARIGAWVQLRNGFAHYESKIQLIRNQSISCSPRASHNTKHLGSRQKVANLVRAMIHSAKLAPLWDFGLALGSNRKVTAPDRAKVGDVIVAIIIVFDFIFNKKFPSLLVES